MRRCLWFVLALCLSNEAYASDEGLVNKLFGPGPLMIGHKDLEHGDCLKCHDAGNGVPDKLCIDCHKDIGTSQQKKSGLHGLTEKPCLSCHSDHKGRNYDAAKVNQKVFDHKLTGFVLRQAHSKIKCEDCHTEKRVDKPFNPKGTRYFGTDPSCKSCHADDDKHKYTGIWAAKECSSCHNEADWKETHDFDHGRDAKYPLEGNHAKLKCEKCHLPDGLKGPAKYEWPGLKEKKCLSCHEDHHRGDFKPEFQGGNCAHCHNQKEWKLNPFNHTVTDFALKGKHEKVACLDCHKQESPKTALKNAKFFGLSNTCKSCHADYHGFYGESSPKLGNLDQCATCHNEAGWKELLKFDHGADAGYPILGKHKKVRCFECHKIEAGNNKKPADRIYEFPSLETKTCETCHKSPHTRTFSPKFLAMRCDSCHTPDDWKSMAGAKEAFNHDTATRFPLQGDHTKVKCDSCHLQGKKHVFKFPGFEKQFCSNCHKPAHKKLFHEKFEEASCATCHNQSDFKNLLSFKHDTTRFSLTGAHQDPKLACNKCHTPTKTLLTTKPPRPAGRFIFPNAEQGFCSNCHKNVHVGQFSQDFAGKGCGECHNTHAFKKLGDFDHNKTDFKIEGAHVKLREECQRCHVKTKKFLATTPPKPAGLFLFANKKSGYCEDCHSSVHKKQFSPEFLAKPCRDCHTQTSFKKRRPFDHDSTDFDIDGAHLAIKEKCEKCHKPTKSFLRSRPPHPALNFRFGNGKTGYCEECHRNEHRGQFHEKFASRPCRDCHNTGDFMKDNHFPHAESRFPLKGKHKKVECKECHKPTKESFRYGNMNPKGQYIFEDLTKKDCALCHKDPHRGSNGDKCSECHSESGWNSTGAFHQNFTLKGIHFTLGCAECHRDGRHLDGMSSECVVCHQKDDVHLGALPDCQECHGQEAFNFTRFKHSLTEFPLRGSHRLLECQACHGQGTYLGRTGECVSCHFQDAKRVVSPSHASAGFDSCKDCHNQFSFRAIKPR